MTTSRIRIERALTLTDPAVGWVVLAGEQGAYCTTWAEAIDIADRIIRRRRAAQDLTDTGIACRAELHELCHATWCICTCHGGEPTC